MKERGTMRILLIKPDCEPIPAEIDGSLESMQKTVGGHIQIIFPFREPVALVCNDEGKLMGLPWNRPLCNPETDLAFDYIAGPFFLCGAPAGNENLTGVTEEQIEYYTAYYREASHTLSSCQACGSISQASRARLFQGQRLCESCFQSRTVICSYCGQRVWNNDEIRYDEGQPICPRCFEEHFMTCEGCGRVLHVNDAFYEEDNTEEYPYCESCYNQRQSRGTIHDYFYKPEPIFYGDGPRYMGVELEIDKAGELDLNAQKLLAAVNQGSVRLYCKHDGSLSDGFELVTHPMSLGYHIHEMPWEAVLREAARLGYRSHQTNTCGLHIHISREAFGASEKEQEAAIARVLYFFEKHWEELLKFSRRTPRQLERWASRYGYKEHPRDILDHAKGGNHAGHYTCVNLQNDRTIEFRMFRGTLKRNTLIATLQLLDRICDVAIFMSDEEVKNLSWTTFVSGCGKPELVQYLKAAVRQ